MIFFKFYDIIIIEIKKEKKIKKICQIVLTEPKRFVIIKKKKKGENNMAVSRKVEREILRNEYLNKLIDFLKEDEEVLRVKSNEIAFPVVGCEDNEDFIVITVKVPTGANKGTEPYDGYAEAEDYELKLKQKAEKAKANAEKKARKIERDKEIRRKKKEIAEKGEK